jgi:phosphatidylserine/phosphatidylglycerophosphate/cardiolipin synthase-like enzyme
MFAGQFAGAKTPSLTTTVDYQGTPVEIHFSPEDDAMPRVIAAVAAAQVSIDFAIFYFTDDVLATALLAAQARGVRVRGLWDALGASDGLANLAPCAPAATDDHRPARALPLRPGSVQLWRLWCAGRRPGVF